MRDQSVYHSVTAQLTIQPSSSAVPSSVLLLAQTSLLRTKGTVNQQTTNEDEESAGAHLTLLNCTRVTPAASGPRVSVASTTSPLPSEPTCHHSTIRSAHSRGGSGVLMRTDAEEASWVRFSFTLLCNSHARVKPTHEGEADANGTHHCSVHHLDFPARPLRHLDRRGVLLRPSAATPANPSARSAERRMHGHRASARHLIAALALPPRAPPRAVRVGALPKTPPLLPPPPKMPPAFGFEAVLCHGQHKLSSIDRS